MGRGRTGPWGVVRCRAGLSGAIGTRPVYTQLQRRAGSKQEQEVQPRGRGASGEPHKVEPGHEGPGTHADSRVRWEFAPTVFRARRRCQAQMTGSSMWTRRHLRGAVGAGPAGVWVPGRRVAPRCCVAGLSVCQARGVRLRGQMHRQWRARMPGGAQGLAGAPGGSPAPPREACSLCGGDFWPEWLRDAGRHGQPL